MSIITTVGTVVLYANRANAKLALFIVIFVFAQVCALFVYAASGMLQTRLNRLSAQVITVVIGYVVFCIVRAYVAEKLLWRAGAISQDLLGWRIRSNLLVNLPGFIGSAWVMNVSATLRAQIDSNLERAEVLERELSELNDRYSEQRSYGERELALEIASAKQLLDAFETQAVNSATTTILREELRSVVYRADQAVRAMISAGVSKSATVVTGRPEISFVGVVDRATQERGVSPWFASLTGFFFAVTYFVDYDSQRHAFIRALGIGAVMFLLLLGYRVVVLPIVKNWPRLWRWVSLEVCISAVSVWWAVAISGSEYSDQLPVALPVVTTLTSIAVMNVMAGAQSVLDQRSIYSETIARHAIELEHAIADIKSTMAIEESTWKSMFVGSISRTPTAATIMLRSVLDEPLADNVDEVLRKVIEIWNSVLMRLRLVT